MANKNNENSISDNFYHILELSNAVLLKPEINLKNIML
jgi:hypothetical protein